MTLKVTKNSAVNVVAIDNVFVQSTTALSSFVLTITNDTTNESITANYSIAGGTLTKDENVYTFNIDATNLSLLGFYTYTISNGGLTLQKGKLKVVTTREELPTKTYNDTVVVYGN